MRTASSIIAQVNEETNYDNDAGDCSEDEEQSEQNH